MIAHGVELNVGEASASLANLHDIDLIVTDPPYGEKYKSGKQQFSYRSGQPIRTRNKDFFKQIKGDKRLPTEWLHPAYKALKNGGAIYVFCRWSQWGNLLTAVGQAGFTPKNMIVCAKSNHGMGDLKGSYAPQHELLLFAAKGRHILCWPKGRQSDVWPVRVPYSGAKRPHPNYKPPSWVTRAIENSSNKGDLVVDPFCGSGSFVKEASRLGRHAIGFDIEAWWDQ